VERKRSGRQAAMKSKRKKKTQSKTKLRWVLVPISMYVIFVVWQNWPQSHPVPAELIGTWRTSDPKYADRYFEFDVLFVNFGTGEGTFTIGIIEKIEAVPAGSRTLYTISYDEEGKEGQCSFYYAPGKEKTIYFKNQPSIAWIKDKET
jgi:hypothetical protein